MVKIRKELIKKQSLLDGNAEVVLQIKLVQRNDISLDKFTGYHPELMMYGHLLLFESIFKRNPNRFGRCIKTPASTFAIGCTWN